MKARSAEVLAAAAQVLGFHEPGKGVPAVEGGHVAGEPGSITGLPLSSSRDAVKNRTSLTFLVPAVPSSDLPWQPSVLLGRTGTPVSRPPQTCSRGASHRAARNGLRRPVWRWSLGGPGGGKT
jgi:hypothetical protein